VTATVFPFEGQPWVELGSMLYVIVVHIRGHLRVQKWMAMIVCH